MHKKLSSRKLCVIAYVRFQEFFLCLSRNLLNFETFRPWKVILLHLCRKGYFDYTVPIGRLGDKSFLCLTPKPKVVKISKFCIWVYDKEEKIFSPKIKVLLNEFEPNSLFCTPLDGLNKP